MNTNTKVLRDNRFLPWWVALVVALWAAVTISFATKYADAAVLTQNLSLGSSGPEVVDLQNFLATDASVYPEGLATGYFGSLTRAAVVRFQALNGISQTGTVGPITRAAINAQQGTSGGYWDVYAPIISNDSVSAGKNSALVVWHTDEAATGRVCYSTVWPFLYAGSARASDNSYVKSHSLTLSGLTPNTTYYYTKESVDSKGNVMWTLHKSFTTGQ